MTETNAIETRLQQPFSQAMLLSLSWIDAGLNENDVAALLAVTVRSLQENRNMPGLAPLLAALLQKA